MTLDLEAGEDMQFAKHDYHHNGAGGGRVWEETTSSQPPGGHSNLKPQSALALIMLIVINLEAARTSKLAPLFRSFVCVLRFWAKG